MKTIVLFRADKAGPFKGVVAAVFPCEPHSSEFDMVCYSHVGQHSACSPGWMRSTRPALPSEYADLKRELETYGPPDAHYDLDVRQRTPSNAPAQRRAVIRALTPLLSSHQPESLT